MVIVVVVDDDDAVVSVMHACNVIHHKAKFKARTTLYDL